MNSFLVARQTYPGLSRFTVHVSRSHLDTPYCVGLLWTSDRSVTEASTWQLTTPKRQTSMPPTGFDPAIQWRTEGGFGVFKPTPRNSESPTKKLAKLNPIVKTVKNC